MRALEEHPTQELVEGKGCRTTAQCLGVQYSLGNNLGKALDFKKQMVFATLVISEFMVIFQEKRGKALGFQVKILKITAKNPRIVKAGKELQDHHVQPAPPPLNHVPKGHIPAALHHLQGW